MRGLLRELYLGRTGRAQRFRYGLLVFDLVTITYVIATSFFRGTAGAEVLDPVLGVLILADFSARMFIARRPLRELMNPIGIADLVVIASLLLPLAGQHLAFLRVLRTLRVFRSYQTVERLRHDVPFFRHNQDLIFSLLNLMVFIMVTTAVVFETQADRNPEITNYIDALYFTVATLTTTGFGDVVLEGTPGRLLAVLMMIVGVSLFFRLAQTIIQPPKVQHTCPACGLSRHDADAVHCKHCGEVLKIPTEGLT